NATRAAIEEGFVPGGGTAFIHARRKVDALELEGDEKLGVQIVSHALTSPLHQIAANAAFEGSLIVQQVATAKGGQGFNAETGEMEDLVKSGVIDPAKVLRTALQNSVSVASIFLTTTCLITDRPEKKENAAPAGHGGMG